MNQLIHVNKILTGFACLRRSTRALSSTTPHATCNNNNIQNIHQRRRRRRGAIHATKRIQLYDNFLLAAVISDNDQPSTLTTTQYTINDSICPPTDIEILNKVVTKHIHTLPRYWKSKPIAKHTSVAFQEALDFILQHPKRTTASTSDTTKTKVIIDGGCGTGRSSFLLGEMHKDCLVIGIDQSLSRLSRNKGYNNNIHESNDNTNKGDNVLLLRAELADFWKCILSSTEWQENIQIHKHYLLYPNPYPKKARLKNRWYAHPAFPLLMMTTEGAELIVRSNWEGYLKEFSQAVNVWSETGANYKDFHSRINNSCESDDDEWHPTIASSSSSTKLEVVGPDRLNIDIAESLTNFEAKYVEIGEPIYELKLFQKAIR